MSLSGKKLEATWKKYKKTGDTKLRNRLLEHYLPLVKSIAERIWSRLPKEVELGDLISAGIFGLVGATKAFELERGVKFETYCGARVRGAILDELRSRDWVPRQVRSQRKKIENACAALEQELGRPPSDEELAKHLGLSLDEYYQLARQATATTIISLSRTLNNDENRPVQEIDLIKNRGEENPAARLQKEDLKGLVSKGLSKKERLIVLLYYYEEMTMKEIGATLDLSESRVCQMHASILIRLKAHLSGREREFQADGR